MVKITGVEKGSHAQKAGIIAGDDLISVNGFVIQDVLDYRFYIMEPTLVLETERNGQKMTFTVKKEEYDDIGLEFSTYLMDEKKRCRNNCIFCFIDQNPKGMRETVYFKDDDERLSFLHGNYVTLTNLKESDIERIVKMRISPINISVHTTNPALRVMMMRNRFAGDCLRYIKMLDDGGISINAQLVLCKGINDGIELENSLTDLLKLCNIESVALVPCGLTGHREGLYELEPFDKESANAVIDIANRFGEKCLAEKGMRLVYPSDEFFLTGQRDIPEEEYYEGYPQLENGVGMIRNDITEFLECLENLKALEYNRKITVATGFAASEHLQALAGYATEKYKNLTVNIAPIRNDFFGGSVTVSGLVTGGDIIAQLKGVDIGEELLIPENMLRAQGDLFLDNVSVEDVEKALSVKVRVVQSGGYNLCEAITGLYE
jgi:putative radical SAM enzyme (TIGR03279 family)